MEDPELVPLGRSSLDAAAASLGRAFAADPMFEWVFPDAASRVERLTVLNRVPLEFALRYDARVMQSDDGRAVAIWLRPGQTMAPLGMLRSGLLGATFKVGVSSMGRFAGANGAMEPVHTKAMGEQPHWQLLIVGVDPSLQGQGRCGALLREGLAKVDADGLPCYLDTSKPENVALYEHFGFVVVDEVPLGKGGPPAWGMRRG